MREWLESKKETDLKWTKYVKVIETSEVQTPTIHFIDSNGEQAETLFVDHAPMDMVT